MTETPKVWVVHTGKYDFSQASEFGVVTPLFSGYVDIFNPQMLIKEIKKKLDIYSTEKDWLLMSSHTFLNMLVGRYFFKRYGKVNCLIFVHKTGDYRPQTVYDFDVPEN